MKKRLNLYIFFVIAFLATLWVVRESAYASLELCFETPAIVEHSIFIKVATNR